MTIILEKEHPGKKRYFHFNAYLNTWNYLCTPKYLRIEPKLKLKEFITYLDRNFIFKERPINDFKINIVTK